MLRIDLSKCASYLYHTQTHKAAYNEIWAVLWVSGLHPKTPINHVFSAETENVIQQTLKIIEAKDKALNQKLKKQ